MLLNSSNFSFSFNIGLSSFFLALEPNQEPLKGSFIGSILRKAVPGLLPAEVWHTGRGAGPVQCGGPGQVEASGAWSH